jgi:hypothetical protein
MVLYCCRYRLLQDWQQQLEQRLLQAYCHHHQQQQQQQGVGPKLLPLQHP